MIKSDLFDLNMLVLSRVYSFLSVLEKHLNAATIKQFVYTGLIQSVDLNCNIVSQS